MKKLMIYILTFFILLFVILVSITVVNATDIKISPSDEGGLNNTITNASNNDTIYLNPGIYSGKNNTNITISKNLTIIGNGTKESVIIDGENLNWLFKINKGFTLTLINITLRNGYAYNYNAGGAVGAVYNDHGKVTIENCIIKNNYGYYGTIRNEGEMIIVDSVLNNNAGEKDGLIFNKGNLTIVGCLIENNTATIDGGAITSTGTVIIENSILRNNTAPNGGAIYLSGGRITIKNSTLTNNKANECGGAVYANNTNIIINSSNFNNNSAIYYGGAIYTGNNAVTNINYSNFKGNRANDHGGAIFNDVNGNIFVFANTMTGNTVTNKGGAIFNNGHMYVSKNIMSGNSAGLGQMIYNNGTMGVLNLTFIDNSTWIVRNGSQYTIYATLTDDMGNSVTGQNISFYINGVLYESIESIEGNASFNFTISIYGDSIVSGKYVGNGDYNIIINNGLLRVRTILTKVSVSVPKKFKVAETVTIESKLVDEDGNPIVGATIDFYVNGKKVGSAVTDSDGIARINYTFDKDRNSNIMAKYAGNLTYEASNATNHTTVSKILTNIKIKTDKNKITVDLKNEYGNHLANKKVTIKVNGKNYTRTTDFNGQIIMKYKNARDCKVIVQFAGDNKYYGSKCSAPKRTSTKITIEVEGNKVTATLTDEDSNPISGKKIIFKVKGVVIGVGTTDANGVTIIFYENAEKQSITSSFEGDETYAPSSATSTPTKGVQASGKVVMKEAGVQIIAVLLVLIASLGLVGYRRRE